MPLDFPPSSSSPYTGSNGITYVWDGTKWVVSGSSIGPYLLLSGGSMSGPIVLAADPATDPQAANKHYVDASINLAGNYLGTWAVASNTPNISAGGSISNANYVATTSNPAVPETVPVGVPGIAGMSVGNGDRIIWASGLSQWQILRNAGVTLAAADARYYAITNPSGYQTAAQVTTALAPYAPLASPPLTGNPTAPTPTYGDNDTSIATTAFVQSAVTPVANNVGRNLLHNSLMAVAQRGTGPWTGNGYTLDRWWLNRNTDTVNVTQNTMSDASRAQIGDESAVFFFYNTFTGNAAAAAYNAVTQPIEGVRRLSGKTVTVSFWASSNSATPKVGVSLDQIFGTGGSPSATVNGTGQSVTIGTAWARYSVTLTIPSASGKTLGTNGDDAIYLNFWFSSGATNATRSGSVGVQSNSVALWGVQLEIGQMTQLERVSPEDDLRRSQRFYQIGHVQMGTYSNAGWNTGYYVTFPVPMRSSPTIAYQNSTYTNATAMFLAVPTATGFQTFSQPTANGMIVFYSDYTASADL